MEFSVSLHCTVKANTAKQAHAELKAKLPGSIKIKELSCKPEKRPELTEAMIHFLNAEIDYTGGGEKATTLDVAMKSLKEMPKDVLFDLCDPYLRLPADADTLAENINRELTALIDTYGSNTYIEDVLP
jgi:hypothetical protein